MIPTQEPSFSNERDEVLLTDHLGNIIDIVVYGDSDYIGEGWSGNPMEDAIKGEVLIRNTCDNEGNMYDTNTSSDWEHVRHHKVGQLDFPQESFPFRGNITLFTSPDSSYEAVTRELERALSNISISMYLFSNWNITETILGKLEDGVEVRILMEGSPVGGIPDEEKYILGRIHEKGGKIRFLATNSTLSSRYNYVHSKYAIIDGVRVVLSSENWVYSGIPVDSSYGNRGWGVVVEDGGVARYFGDVFERDWNHVDYDLVPFSPQDPVYGNASPDFIFDHEIKTGYHRPLFSIETVEGDFVVTPVLSPDTSLLDTNSITALIASANDTIYIEQHIMALNWDDADKHYENQYLSACIRAARERHVDVKILLCSLFASSDDPGLDNYDTYRYINDYAQKHNITTYLEARLVDYDRLDIAKLHNKGMIVDGTKTLISSINWNRNSVTQNREAGVIILNRDVAQYFTRIFMWDWNEPPFANAEKPLIANQSEEVQLFDLSFDPDGNIESYHWDFDDGTNSTERNPVHVFKEEGIYDVKLTVSDGQYYDSHTITVVVVKPKNEEGGLTIMISIFLMLVFIVLMLVLVVFIRRLRQLFT
jgi:phosphatidylserine/phosphatidylglycerophosphate/cardiolipin synthase-like enzyme